MPARLPRLSLLLLPLAGLCPTPAGAELWIGPYAGLHLGLGGGRSDVEEINGPRAQAADTRGPAGGVQFGWSWQSGRLVAGLELELGHLGQSGDVSQTDGGATLRSTAELGLQAAVSGRAGWLLTPELLLFGRIGGSAARFEASTTQSCAGTCNLTPSRAAASGTTYGLVLGAGLERALDAQWRLRLDYVHHGYREELVLPPAVPGGPGWRHSLDLHVVRLGLNYRF